MDKAKLYCFVDETGQDTYGQFFLVFIVLFEQAQKDSLELMLEAIERRTGKNKKKWKSTGLAIKKVFLQEIIKLKELKRTLFYSVYRDTKKYNYLTALTIAKAVASQAEVDYFVSIVVDGLTEKDMEKMKSDLKGSKVKYKHIRGMKDEQSVFLRLADALAGFTRDSLEGEAYTKPFFDLLKAKDFLKEM